MVAPIRASKPAVFFATWACLLPTLLILTLLHASSANGAIRNAGRPVVDVLRELQNSGLTLIYNDEVVPRSLLVVAEPEADHGIALLTEILAPHGLMPQSVGPGAWSIVAAPSLERPPEGSTTVAPQARPLPLEEVVVATSQYVLARDNIGSRTSLSHDELRSLPALADEPLRAVHRLPGAASNGLSGLAHIRGGAEDETQIVFDGMVLTEPFHLRNFFSPVSLLDVAIISSLDVYAGGFPAQYGNRMSAVIDANSVDPGPDGSYELGLSLFHANGLAGGDFAGQRGHWLVSARRSNLTEVIKLANSDFGEPDYLDAFSKVEFDFSEATSGALHVLVSRDHIALSASAETEVSNVADHNAYVWGTLDHRWSHNVSGHALLSYAESESDRTGSVNQPGEQIGSVDDERNNRETALRLELRLGDEDLRTRVGFEVGRLDATYHYASEVELSTGSALPAPPTTVITRNSILSPDGYKYAAFASSRWRITERVTGEAGLRWDRQTYTGVSGGTQLSPRINLLYDLDSDTQLRASWGRFYQAQGIKELQVEDGVETFSAPQWAEHSILSVEHLFPAGPKLRFEAYRKDYGALRPRFENLFDPVVLLPELRDDRVRVAPNAGTVHGLEMLLNRRDAGPWGWWLSYTWSRAEEEIDGAEIPRSWDQRHSINAGVNWADGPWAVTVAGTWHTGWPTTPVLLGPPVDGSGDPSLVVGPRNSQQFGNFTSVDLRVGYSFPLGPGELLTFIEFTNLLGLRNPCCADYALGQSDNGDFGVRQNLDYWPRFVPNLGVLWKFGSRGQ